MILNLHVLRFSGFFFLVSERMLCWEGLLAACTLTCTNVSKVGQVGVGLTSRAKVSPSINSFCR